MIQAEIRHDKESQGRSWDLARARARPVRTAVRGVNCAGKLTSHFKEVRYDPLVSVPCALVLRRYVHVAAESFVTYVVRNK